MAIAISQIYAGGAANGNGIDLNFANLTGFTSGSFTPTNNSLLVVLLNTANNVGSANSVANIGISGGSLSWTKQSSISFFNTASLGFQSGLVVFTAPVTTGSSMTFTTTGYASNTTCSAFITAYCVTGYNTSTPIGATALNNDNTSLTPTLTLSASPSSTSLVFSGTNGGVSTSSTGVTAGTGFTRITQFTDNNYFALGSEYNTNTTSTSVPWGSVDAGDSGVPGNNSGQFAVEFLASSGETITMDKWYSQSVFTRPFHYRKIEMIPY